MPDGTSLLPGPPNVADVAEPPAIRGADAVRTVVFQHLKQARCPWLLIEDTHVTTFRVKAFLAGAMQSGDRLVVEDGFSKQHEITRASTTWMPQSSLW